MDKVCLVVGDEYHFGAGADYRIAAIKAATSAYIKNEAPTAELRHSDQWYLRVGFLQCGVTVNDCLACTQQERSSASYLVETFEPFNPWAEGQT